MVQHRFTRIVPRMRTMMYGERLEELRIRALEERRNRANLTEVFKILKGFTSIDTKQGRTEVGALGASASPRGLERAKRVSAPPMKNLKWQTAAPTNSVLIT